MAGTLTTRNRGAEPGVAVKYTPCAKGDHTDDELEEISIVEKQEHGVVKDNHSGRDISSFDSVSNHDMDSRNQTPTANGPRQTGIGAFQAYPSPKTRTPSHSIGARLSSSGGRISLSSPVYSSKVVEQKSRSTSQKSLLDLFGTRLDRGKGKKSFSSKDEKLLLTKTKSKEILTARQIRKQRQKDIEEKFGKKSLRTNEIRESNSAASDRDGCNWTFVFDPAGRFAYWWSSVVSVAFLYNFWVIIYRFAFQEIDSENHGEWFALDYTADFLYILDIVFHFRTGYLEDGVLQTDSVKLRIHYMNDTIFYIDLLCLLPLDFLYLSIGFCSILRCFRLVKVYRFWAFLDRTERHTNYPNVMRTLMLMHYLLALFHWNACLYYIVASRLQKSSSTWTLPKDDGNVARQYLHALYWSTLTLTTIGNLPYPHTIKDYLFIIFEMIFGLLLFATVLGHVSNIVTCISAARKDFQAKLDGVKTYMSLRRVPLRLQDRVIKWFDYLWYCNKSTDEERTLSLLPDKLKAEIAIHVHLDTLKRVEVFQNTEAGFLCELVLRLKPVLFSPGDYICRKGEVGKEMYIVNRGKLHVVGDNGKSVLATLKPGSYFGEISILNMGTSGNRRTASVRSVGYSDLFRLSKEDMWDVLKEYPQARVKLESIAVKRLEKTKQSPIEKASMSRSKSTPGLVESDGKVPLETMIISRHHTLPAGLPVPHSQNSDYGVEPQMSEAPPEDQEQIDGAEHDPSAPSVGIATVGTMTKSLTISSMTSYNAGSPPQRSPLYSETKFTISPPPSPGLVTQAQNVSRRGSTCLPFGQDVLSRGSPTQLSPLHLAYSPSYPASQHTHPMNFLSPYCASNSLHPPSSPMAMGRADNLSSSQTNLASPQTHSAHSLFYQQQPTMPVSPAMTSNMASVSPASFSFDTSQEVLLLEITTLRQRLISLESENAAMTVKLSQQQWNVEHRLAELEMHLCHSSSVASTTSQDERTDRFDTVNRESII
ncbi:cyclic nucleotide-gated channel rod photoreceptor subunit alpha-like [Mizuhopecten yessoensis]|nr:cyclic nucleotide-gated channel rod photoreceptor subunit alpha-like [Mizuhopecten yessoensis]